MSKFELFRSTKNNQWAWRFRTSNGKSVCWSGETYHNKADALHGLNLVKQNAQAAPIVEK